MGIGRSGAVSDDASVQTHALHARLGTSWHGCVKGLVPRGCGHISPGASPGMGQCVLGWGWASWSVLRCVQRQRGTCWGWYPAASPGLLFPIPLRSPMRRRAADEEGREVQGFPLHLGWLWEPPMTGLHPPGWLAPTEARLSASCPTPRGSVGAAGYGTLG